MQLFSNITAAYLSLSTSKVSPRAHCEKLNKTTTFEIPAKFISLNNSISFDTLGLISLFCLCGFSFRVDSLSKVGYLEASPNDKWNKFPKIPQILHQTWKTRKISEHSNTASESKILIDNFAKDWMYVLWTDNDILQLIDYRYPEYKEFYLGLNMNIKRSDMARYFIVHSFGGLYMDLDVTLRGPAADIILPRLPHQSQSATESYQFPIQFVSYQSREFRKSQFLGNAVFAAVPNSTVFLYMYRYAESHHLQNGRTIDQVLKHTGPFALGASAAMYCADNNYSDIYSGCPFEKGRTIFVHPSASIGNVKDSPKLAVHHRKHRWESK
jgi:hypothetical protein